MVLDGWFHPQPRSNGISVWPCLFLAFFRLGKALSFFKLVSDLQLVDPCGWVNMNQLFKACLFTSPKERPFLTKIGSFSCLPCIDPQSSEAFWFWGAERARRFVVFGHFACAVPHQRMRAVLNEPFLLWKLNWQHRTSWNLVRSTWIGHQPAKQPLRRCFQKRDRGEVSNIWDAIFAATIRKAKGRLWLGSPKSQRRQGNPEVAVAVLARWSRLRRSWHLTYKRGAFGRSWTTILLWYVFPPIQCYTFCWKLCWNA